MFLFGVAVERRAAGERQPDGGEALRAICPRPSGEPVYFSMICSALSSTPPPDSGCHAWSCKVTGKRCRSIPTSVFGYTPLSPVFGICRQSLRVDPARIRLPEPCLHQLILLNEAGSMAAISARVAVPCGSSRLPIFLHKAAADRPLHRRRLCVIQILSASLNLSRSPLTVDREIFVLRSGRRWLQAFVRG